VSGQRREILLPLRPHGALRDAVRTAVGELEGAGMSEAALRLREAMVDWSRGERDWTDALTQQLRVHHDINNALVGVRGNAQLLMMGPAATTPGVRDRLEVVLRESDRIREAALRLNALKTALVATEGAEEGVSRAA